MFLYFFLLLLFACFVVFAEIQQSLYLFKSLVMTLKRVPTSKDLLFHVSVICSTHFSTGHCPVTVLIFPLVIVQRDVCCRV